MRKMGRRVLAVVVAVCLAMGVVVLPDMPEEVRAESFGDFEYEVLDDETVEITGYTGSAGEVEIPEMISGRRVTSIGIWVFYNCIGLTEISIPSNVASIGESAFNGCTGLTEISIPSSVVSIGYCAFNGCTGLTEISIPSSVTSIGYSAFENCTGLMEISLPSSVTSIGNYVFEGCTGLTEISIPSSVTSIGDCAFYGCTGLTKISLPGSVTSIEYAAFYNCTCLTDVYYSGSKEQWDALKNTIGDRNDNLLNAEIHYNSDLTDDTIRDYEYRTLTDGTIEITKYNGSDAVVTVPDSIDGKRVTRIGGSAFKDCTNIREISLPSSVTSIGENAFCDCTSLTEISIPGGVASIEDGAFRGCTNLTSINLPSSVMSIGHSVFRGCTGLTEISIPSSVTSIGNNAFWGCVSLTEVILPSGVTSIGNNVFLCCTSLTQVSLPSGVTSIGDSAFSGCISLAEISLSSGVTSIGEYAFHSCTNLAEISIPSSVTSIGINAFDECMNLKDVYYSDTKEQWDKIEISESGNEELLNATIHFKEDPSPTPPKPDPSEEPVLPITTTAKEELERLKSGDPFSLEQDFQHYLSPEQIDILESCLFTWLADVNYAYQYSGSNNVKQRIRKKAGIDPQGDFTSGTERAITHISVMTMYGPKTIEITLDLGKPDAGGNLYPSYGSMHYEVLPKSGIPSDVPRSGQIGRDSYADLGPFVECVRRVSDDSLHGTYQWQSLFDELVAGILIDRTITEIIGNKNGAFTDAIFTIYASPLFTYSKKVTISCPVDVYIYDMAGNAAGSIVDNQPNGGSANVRLDVVGDSKTVYLTGNDYYLNLRGTDTGTMKYEVEEIANEEVCRNVQFLELQLKKDMQYEGYVFRPLNIDSDLYALRTVGSSASNEAEVIRPNADSYQPQFKKIQSMSLSQQNTSIGSDKTVQLNASLFPLDASNPNLQWISDNPSVATVGSDGLVTAIGAGRATITVMTRDGSFLKQSCIVDVEGRTIIPDPDNPTQPDTPTQPDNPTQPNTPTQPETPSGRPDAPTQPTSPTQPGTPSIQPGNSSTGTDDPSGQPEQPTDPPKEDEPVVTKLYYIVQFHTNGGTNLSRRTMTLLDDDVLGILPKVQRKSYLFSGWYTMQNGGTRVYGDKKLNEATTLYAHWTRAAAPAKAAIQKLASGKKGQAKASFKQVSGASGYQIQYATSKAFTSSKKIEASALAKVKTITGLKAGKKYYVRMRAYRKDSMGNKIYGAYSAVKSVKVKA